MFENMITGRSAGGASEDAVGAIYPGGKACRVTPTGTEATRIAKFFTVPWRLGFNHLPLGLRYVWIEIRVARVVGGNLVASLREE